MRALLSHCLYRRVLLWAITGTILLCLVLSSSGVRTRHGRILDLVDFRKTTKIGLGTGAATIEQQLTIEKPNEEGKKDDGKGRDPLHWLEYKQ